jgi:nickel-type superoxide dismutase maturation protease
MEPPPSFDDGSKRLEPETYHRGRKPFSTVAASVVVTAGVGWACLRWKPSRVEIEGGSMAPTLVPGDWALVVTPRRFDRGDVVVVEHPGRTGYEMVKRLVGLPGDRLEGRALGESEFWVTGDFPAASTDSRAFGPITADHLKAKVVLIYRPKVRRALVR